MSRMGNTFGKKQVSTGHARKIWREVKDQFPVGGMVTNVSDFLTDGKGKIPAGTFCKRVDLGANGGVQVTCYTKAQIAAASNISTLGINGATLYDIDIEDANEKASATVIYAGEMYAFMVHADVLAKVKDIPALSEIKFV